LTPKILRTSKVLAGNISRFYLRPKPSYPFSFVVAIDIKHNTKWRDSRGLNPLQHSFKEVALSLLILQKKNMLEVYDLSVVL